MSMLEDPDEPARRQEREEQRKQVIQDRADSLGCSFAVAELLIQLQASVDEQRREIYKLQDEVRDLRDELARP